MQWLIWDIGNAIDSGHVTLLVSECKHWVGSHCTLWPMEICRWCPWAHHAFWYIGPYSAITFTCWYIWPCPENIIKLCACLDQLDTQMCSTFVKYFEGASLTVLILTYLPTYLHALHVKFRSAQWNQSDIWNCKQSWRVRSQFKAVGELQTGEDREFQMDRPAAVNECQPKTKYLPWTTYFLADADRVHLYI